MTRQTRILLRLEGLAALALAAAAYAAAGAPWWLFAALLLAPDLAMAGYALGPRAGAAAYNAAHSYVAPALLWASGAVLGADLAAFALIWAAHIGMDRALGYGLKGRSFAETHLGALEGPRLGT